MSERFKSFPAVSVGIIVSVSVGAFESFGVAASMPAAAREFGEVQNYYWAFSAFFLTMMIGMAAGGRMADLWGFRLPFMVGNTIFTLGLIAGGASGSMLVLILGRTFQGFGVGLANAGTYAGIAALPAGQRGRMLALVSSAWAVPSLAGPMAASLITQYLGWRWVFFGLSCLPVLAVLITGKIPQDSARVRTASRFSLIPAAISFSCGIAVVSGALTSSTDFWICMSASALGTILLSAGLIRAMRTQTRHYALLILLNVILNMSFFGIDAALPMMLSVTRYQGFLLASAPLTAGALGWITSAWVQSRIVSKTGTRILILAGGLLVTVGLVVVGWGLNTDLLYYSSIAGWAISGAGMGFAYNTISMKGMELASTDREGEETVFIQLTGILGMAVGTGIGSIVFSRNGLHSSQSGFLQIFLFFALALLLVFPFSLTLKRDG